MPLYRLTFVTLLIFLAACSPLKQIKNPDTPFERECSSLLPPEGNGWKYVQGNQGKIYDLHFSRQGISPTNKTTARYMELKANTNFGSPEHFLAYIQNLKEEDVDRWEYQIVERQWVLDDRFGEYSLRYYVVLKYIDPARMNPNDYSLSKRFGYVILHPYFNNIIIDIFYEEQGKPAEINPKFEEQALQFIKGLHLKHGE